MADSNSGTGSITPNRRAVLVSLGTAVTAGLAGCGGDGGGSDGDDGGSSDSGQDSDSGGDGQSSGMDSTGGGGSGSGGGGRCPAMPGSYDRMEIPTMLSDRPTTTIGVPASGGSVDSQSTVLTVEYDIGSITVQSEHSSDTTVDEELSPEMTEVTGEYDLPADARAQRETAGMSSRVDVYIPDGSGVVMVSVAASAPEECRDGSLGSIRDEMVNSIQLG